MRKIGKIVILIIIALILWGCGTTISAIYEKPEVYNGKKMEISGVVSDIIKIPATSFSVYFLKDDTGEIPVFSIIEKEKDTRVSVKVQVIAVPAENIAGASEEAIKAVEKFLIKNEVVNENIVSIAAGGIVNIVKTAGSVFDGIFLLLETQE